MGSGAIGVDIGGTFTDVVMIVDGNVLHHVKVSTTADQVTGVLQGTNQVLKQADFARDKIRRFVHGSTVATNAVLEQTGATLGILTTDGFEDVLEIGRQKRSRMYDLLLTPETPRFLAPRRRRLGVPERVSSDGSVVKPLDEEAVRSHVKRMVEEFGVEAIAVCYLFSFRNPSHEVRTREIIEDLYPDVDVSLSSDIDPQPREYERLVVTSFDAYLRGVIRKYIEKLERQLNGAGIDAPLQILQSRGGITRADVITRKPVNMLLSGLAGGVIGALYAASTAGVDDVISLDMGGTSCDVALIDGKKPIVANESRIGSWPLRVPMVDVHTIGAGGGSISWVDDAGGLRVGPRSAGSIPGPVAYARGGTEPTVTDASLVLGYLNPDNFAGGVLELDPELAYEAIGKLAEQVGLSPLDTADGIHRIVNARMADEIRMVSVRRGYDHRRFRLLALGGAGPTHGGALIRELRIPQMIVPNVPGVLSALGLLVAPIERDQVASVGLKENEITDDALIGVLNELNQQGFQKMAHERVPQEKVTVSEFAQIRYVGQSESLTVPVDSRQRDKLVKRAVTAFHGAYRRLYGHSHQDAAVEFVSVRTVHSRSQPPLAENLSSLSSKTKISFRASERPVYFREAGGFINTPIADRSALTRDDLIEGPLIVEQTDTTTIVHPGQQLRVHDSGTLIVEEI